MVVRVVTGSAAVVRPWQHVVTTSDLSLWATPTHDAGTGLAGAALGHAQHGAAFIFDPFDAYRAGLVTNPNVAITGSIGAGKSTLVKMLVRRGVERGHRAVIVDPKAEYAELAALAGGTVVSVGDGAWCNPFVNASSQLVTQLLAALRDRDVDDVERSMLDEWWREHRLSERTRPIRALYELARDHDDPTTRGLAATLRRLVVGDLAGLVDGDGPSLTLDGNVVVLDLSRWWTSDVLRAVSFVATTAAEQLLAVRDAPGYLVIDEAWAILQSSYATQWLRGSWKLARARGVAHVVVLHRVSDVDAVGDAGSAQRARAVGLLRDCETSFLFRTPPAERDELVDTLGLGTREAAYLTALPRGVALARYGPYRSIVRLAPSEADRLVIDTDGAMR